MFRLLQFLKRKQRKKNSVDPLKILLEEVNLSKEIKLAIKLQRAGIMKIRLKIIQLLIVYKLKYENRYIKPAFL